MKTLKPRYRVKRIQDLKAGEIVFDELHSRHLIVSAPGVYQEGHLYGTPAWKFAYQVCGKPKTNGRIIAWLPENSEVFVYSHSLR